MPIGNGGIIGVANDPTDTVASGVWDLIEQFKAEKAGDWPIFVPPYTAIGQPIEGGFWAGDISTNGDGIATHHLIVAPDSTGRSSLSWRSPAGATPGADSVIDGPQNTADMVADGNSTVYPAAHFCNDATIGGFTDWYMPALNELRVLYVNLKPTTASNATNVGTNVNEVPARASNYTSGSPAQTSSTAFQSGGAQAFTNAGGGFVEYWSSTEASANNAQIVRFANGAGTSLAKTGEGSPVVRCIRRVPV